MKGHEPWHANAAPDEFPETCEDRGYQCCDNLGRRLHFLAYGYVSAGDKEPTPDELREWSLL